MIFRQPFKGDYPITQKYGENVTSSFHTGIDYGLPIGTPVFSSADGVVRYNGQDKTGYGNCVIIEHDSKHSTLYAHLNTTAYLMPGSKVQQGEIIGWSGNTGNSTGPHLHFEARKIWNDFRSHFDPFDLPLMSMIDQSDKNSEPVSNLKEASVFVSGEQLTVTAPLGAYAHNIGFTSKQILYPGAKLIFTGETILRNGLTFCKCEPVMDPVWVAVNDGETQILDRI